MKIFENVLSHETLARCLDERNHLLSQNSWGISGLRWPKEILVGVAGTTACAYVSPHLWVAIATDIENHVPHVGFTPHNLYIQHYAWLPGSGLSRHNDSGWKFSATIYLNEDWNIDFGGVLLWEDTLTDTERASKTPPSLHNVALRGVCPSFNAMALNTDSNIHMVTTISALAPEPRFTLQIRYR